MPPALEKTGVHLLTWEVVMGHRFARAAGCVIAALALAGCAVTEARRQQDREALSRRIVDDTIAYNEAYSAAISGQILLNILRAHNRQPRQYMSMSGFTNSAPDSRTTTLGISALPLGDLGQEWGQGALERANTRALEPEYKVQPFAGGAYSSIVLEPAEVDVFSRYWLSGWNKDLILILLVDSMEITPLDGSAPRALYNSAGTIAANCEGSDYNIGGCAFVHEVRRIVENTWSDPIPRPRAAANVCQPIAIYEVGEARNRDARLRQRAPTVRRSAAEPCPISIIIGATRYTFRARSLDAMVYYVGELLRRDERSPELLPAMGLEARLSVRAPGSRTDLTPLFRIVPADEQTERDYAATVTFGGRRFSAGAPADRFCYSPTSEDICSGPIADRSGTVLEFLTGILAYSQSEAAVSAPQNAIFDTR